MKRLKCPECLGSMKLIRDGEIAKCKTCGGQYDPTYVDGFTDGFKQGKKQVSKG
jgi:hypothetical protein